MPAQGLWASIQGLTPWAATALTMGAGYWVSSTPYLASQCHVPACGQPPVLVGEPFWPLGGPHGVSLLSF